MHCPNLPDHRKLCLLANETFKAIAIFEVDVDGLAREEVFLELVVYSVD
jgi:hypothetical protein